MGNPLGNNLLAMAHRKSKRRQDKNKATSATTSLEGNRNRRVLESFSSERTEANLPFSETTRSSRTLPLRATGPTSRALTTLRSRRIAPGTRWITPTSHSRPYSGRCIQKILLLEGSLPFRVQIMAVGREEGCLKLRLDVRYENDGDDGNLGFSECLNLLKVA